MVVRFLNLVVIPMFSIKLYAPATSIIIFAFTLALVAKFQPYKCKRNNTVDIVMLLTMIIAYLSNSMYATEV